MKVWLFHFIFGLFLTFTRTREKEKDEKHLCDTCVINNCSQRNYKYPSKMIKCSLYKENKYVRRNKRKNKRVYKGPRRKI